MDDIFNLRVEYYAIKVIFKILWPLLLILFNDLCITLFDKKLLFTNIGIRLVIFYNFLITEYECVRFPNCSITIHDNFEKFTFKITKIKNYYFYIFYVLQYIIITIDVVFWTSFIATKIKYSIRIFNSRKS